MSDMYVACHRVRVVKETDLKSVGASLAGSNPVDVVQVFATFTPNHPPTVDRRDEDTTDNQS